MTQKLSAVRRADLAAQIREHAVGVGVGCVEVEEVDRLNVYHAALEAMRRAVVRHMRRRGRHWIRIFPDKPVTAKPAETRMGKGKGSVDRWVSVVKPGRILFEVADVPEDIAREALRLAGDKLPIRTQIVSREERG